MVVFDRAKNKPSFKHKDINQIKDFYTLEDIVEKLVQSGVTHSKSVARQVPGADIIHNDDEYVVYRVGSSRDETWKKLENL